MWPRLEPSAAEFPATLLARGGGGRNACCSKRGGATANSAAPGPRSKTPKPRAWGAPMLAPGPPLPPRCRPLPLPEGGAPPLAACVPSAATPPPPPSLTRLGMWPTALEPDDEGAGDAPPGLPVLAACSGARRARSSTVAMPSQPSGAPPVMRSSLRPRASPLGPMSSYCRPRLPVSLCTVWSKLPATLGQDGSPSGPALPRP
mmetsp:Transcript_93832/g.265693  ORF Transcript_93832/g.265693 Transcript_93832/m.265693 type:complete len:203 (+) Transcript_93832:53-661(+)